MWVRLVARSLVFALFLSAILPTITLVWMNFSPDPVAERAVQTVNGRLKRIGEAPQRASLVERAGFRLLYTGMLTGGRVPFPEAADNLHHLFSGDGRDQMLHSGRLFWSPTLRSGLHAAQHGKRRVGLVECARFKSPQRQCSIREPRTPLDLKDVDFRAFFLYNPWQLRVREFGPVRVVAVYQWMKFVDAETPFLPGSPRPIKIRDDLLELGGSPRPYTAYNLWVEPNLPTWMYLAGAYVIHGLRGVVGLLAMLCAPLLVLGLWFGRAGTAERWIRQIATLGLMVVTLRLLWDLALDLSAAALVLPGGSEAWTTDVGGGGFAARPASAQGEGVLGVLFATTTHLVENLACACVCLGIARLVGGQLRSGLQLGVATMMVFPVYGLPWPLALSLVPAGLVLMWRLPLGAIAPVKRARREPPDPGPPA